MDEVRRSVLDILINIVRGASARESERLKRWTKGGEFDGVVFVAFEGERFEGCEGGKDKVEVPGEGGVGRDGREMA